jgi:hypothetical protein
MEVVVNMDEARPMCGGNICLVLEEEWGWAVVIDLMIIW